MASVSGWITQEKFIVGSTPTEMEEILGLPPGYFSHGAVVWALQRFPASNEFELGGLTHWPGGQPVSGDRVDRSLWSKDFVSKHKGFARDSWSHSGPDRPVKVTPNHAPSYVPSWPKGRGAKQWKLVAEIPAVEIMRLGKDEPYRPYKGKY
jgi:hypothetical protein